jgi:glycosyltransferase involved in cell wall biosynthesis
MNRDRMNETRVAHVTTISLSLVGLLRDQLWWLRDQGFRVDTVSSPGPETDVLTKDGFPHFAVPMSRRITPLKDAVALGRLVRLFRRERFDIVHTHTPKAGLLAQLAARVARVPLVINTIHGLYLDYGNSKIMRAVVETAERIAASASDLILFQNRESMEFFHRRKLARPEKCVFIGNGIDLSKFDRACVADDAVAAARRRLGVSPGQRVLGFVGRLAARRKGLSALIEASLQVMERHPDVIVAIIGEGERDGSDRVPAELMSRATASGRFRFLGTVANDELPPLYASMTLLLLPSLYEGLPRVVMEAAALGVPSIVTDVQGNREAVVDGVTGRIVPYADVPALAAAIDDTLANPERLAALGEGARAHAARHFDQRRVFEKITECYERLLAAKAAR